MVKRFGKRPFEGTSVAMQGHMKHIPITPGALQQEREKIKEKGKRNTFRRTAHPKVSYHRPAPHIELFQLEACSESHRVRRRLGELKLEYISRMPQGDQYPLLVDYESGVRLEGAGAIEAYLNSHYSRPESGLRKYTHKIVTTVEGQADKIRWKLKSVVDHAETAKRDLQDTVETLKGAARILKTALRAH